MTENIPDNFPRKVTSREIFDELFVTKWVACLKLAKGKLSEEIPDHAATIAEILAATAQLFICWNQNEGMIENHRARKQERLDNQKR